jgi:lipopolysaccharide transport system ATP-binding protein
MKDTIISVKNIGKKYNINHERGGYVALRDVITNIFRNPLGFLKSKTKEVFGIETKEDFWALKNINFEVEKGDVVGIIGRNGAGKSTLLKILSQITPPTTGEIKINGTIGSLLEVGTGFHPELTGRENIFLNGAILGMKKREIIKKFDDIVKFAEIEKFLDTPVKYYSSGMYVRLAFSVAAHMDTDILIVDEVLAVGDTEFQKKCLGKMEEITSDKKRTIIFVSHNMSAIKDLCNKSILIENGEIKNLGETQKVINLYNKENREVISKEEVIEFNNTGNSRELMFRKIYITNKENNLANTIPYNEDFNINIEFDIEKEIGQIEITISIKNSLGINVTSSSFSDQTNGKIQSLKKGRYATRINIGGNFLIPDIYTIRLFAHEKGLRDIDIREEAIRFKISESDSSMKSYGDASIYWNCVFSNAKWQLEKKS